MDAGHADSGDELAELAHELLERAGAAQVEVSTGAGIVYAMRSEAWTLAVVAAVTESAQSGGFHSVGQRLQCRTCFAADPLGSSFLTKANPPRGGVAKPPVSTQVEIAGLPM